MIIDRISRQRTSGQGVEILLGSLESTLNAGVDVVALLEIYIFEEVAADGARGNGIAVHFDSLHVRNRAFDGHQASTKIFVDTRATVGFCHRSILA
jgi:hypothetical protein